MLSTSSKVKGMETERSKSDRARLKMKMFLAVLSSFLLKTAAMIQEFPITNKQQLSLRGGFTKINRENFRNF